MTTTFITTIPASFSTVVTDLSGNPIDVSDYDIEMVVSVADVTLFTLSTENFGILLTDPDNGVFVTSLSLASIDATPGDADYVLTATFNGVTQTLASGTFADLLLTALELMGALPPTADVSGILPSAVEETGSLPDTIGVVGEFPPTINLTGRLPEDFDIVEVV